MKVSTNFTLEEFTRSQTATRRGISNEPTTAVLDNIHYTALQMEKVRDLLGGNPIHISSGYRSLELNKKIGGSSGTSQHVLGQAVDFTCDRFGTVTQIFDAIRNSNIVFDQMIWEYGAWVHLSFRKENNRRECLRKERGKPYKRV